MKTPTALIDVNSHRIIGGKCPIEDCGGDLLRDGDYLQCEKNDYRILFAEFERHWQQWEQMRRVSQKTGNDAEVNLKLALALLGRLQAANLITSGAVPHVPKEKEDGE